MKKLALFGLVLLLAGLALAPAVLAAGGEITIKIASEVTDDHVGQRLLSCTHYYSVSQGGAEVVPVTVLPDNEVTNVVLPKINDTYIVHFYCVREYVSGTDPMDEFSFDAEFSGKKNGKITFTANWIAHGTRGTGFGSFGADTAAGTEAGDVTIPLALALGALGFLAAALGSAAGGGDEEGEKGSSYAMVIHKDFGDKIKYNGDTVYVYAKMMEITSEGSEIDRPDLTAQITIFSGSPHLLDVSESVLTGQYMGAGVMAGAAAGADINTEVVISFRYTGDIVIQNNVTFKLVGEAYIALAREKVLVQATSGKSLELPYELVNFAGKVDEITVGPIQTRDAFFDLGLGQNENQESVIVVTDRTPQGQRPKGAFDSFSCEIVAKNDQEYARTIFTVVMCYEGLVADFPDAPRDEEAVVLEADGVSRSSVVFYFHVWDPEQKTLVARPQALENLAISRKPAEETLVQNAATVSGLAVEYERPYPGEGVLFSVHTQKPFPANQPYIAVEMEAGVDFGDNHYSCDFTVKLVIPDVSPGSDSWEIEYEKLKKIIDQLVPVKHQNDFFKIIHDKKNELDAPGLVLLRRTLIEKATELNGQIAQGYLNEAAWYDTAIWVCEYLEMAGDVAMSALTMAFMGPLAGVGADVIRQYVMSALKAMAEGQSLEVWFDTQVQGIIPLITGMGMGMLTDPQTIEYALGRSVKTQVIAWGVYFGYNFYNEMYNNKKSLYEAAKSTAAIFAKKIAVKFLAGRLVQVRASQKISALKDKINSEGGLSKEAMLEIMQDSQFVRSIKATGDPDLQAAFNRALKQHVYAPHDTALLHWIKNQPDFQGKEFKIDEFRTPGKAASTTNVDRDYRVLMQVGNDWVEVPPSLYKNKSYQIFSERTGFDPQVAHKSLGVEQEAWEKMSANEQREMWANKTYRQLATDQWHAESCADFSDQNVEGTANITRVKAGAGRLQDADGMGRMYEHKVIGELLSNKNKTEALAQLQKGYEQLIEVRKGYAKQEISLPRMDEGFTSTMRELNKVPTDLRAGNAPHFIKNDTILDMAAKLRNEIARLEG